ncbi:MAG: ribonuclease HI family protein [Armatimonadetes bacterium]|nr:ribonuclease HI family protein [Armatimonadota bacterium]
MVTPVDSKPPALQAIIAVDGASRGNPGPAGAGVAILSPAGDVLQEISVPIAHATNNVAEYTGLLKGLEAARELGLRRVEVRTDSELMVRQLNGQYRVKNPGLQRLHAQATQLIDRFEACRIRHVNREKNVLADRLASAAAREAGRAPAGKPTQGRLDL